ncbi:GRIP and coiled-coil domain-containing protein 1-like [Oratosquilla oratoria]|uniref:GRIP and coiled-coil domain-containing protein 1-like n=1 Tax=Oratosquilla oratoria TaxID=337810 RepID=UPI003F7726C5
MLSGRKELLATVDQQREQLAKYEHRLRDVVRAYKSLAKEKEALQASLTALTTSTASDNSDLKKDKNRVEESSSGQQDNGSSKSPGGTGEGGSAEAAKDSGSTGEKTEGSIDVSKLQAQLATLSSSLATLTVEKQRMETSFQSDKKRLLEEKQKLESSLMEADLSKANQEKMSDQKIKELKSRIIVQQHERDQDTQNSAVMIRELESKLAIERNKRESMESALEESEDKLKRLNVLLNHRPAEQYEKRITDLQNELEQVRGRLKRAELQAQEASTLQKVEAQLDELRTQHEVAVQQERRRAEQAEDASRRLSRAHEERVVALEARLSELSQTVASYDRTRQQDLEAIQKLKNQVSDLAQENTTLVSNNQPDADSSNLDAETISHRISKLLSLLKKANLRCNHPVDIASLIEGEEMHSRCQKDYDNLKEEFERYKTLARKTSQSEIEDASSVRSQLEEAREKLRFTTNTARITSEQHLEQITQLKEDVASTKAKYEQQIYKLENDHRVNISRLEQQLAGHQERSLATLQERDEEIQRLTKEVHDLRNPRIQGQYGTMEAAAALLSKVGASGGTEGPLLHHLEELARKEMEINQLRKEKRQTESTMRELQMAALVKQQTYQDTIEMLQEQVERHKRNVSREGENLEYLKNVVLRYMTSSDMNSRQMMLNAIAAVLKFTSDEVESVKQYNALWWWQQAPKSKMPGLIRYAENFYEEQGRRRKNWRRDKIEENKE